MKRTVAITGASGLVGRGLQRALASDFEVRALKRGRDWHADGSAPSDEALQGADALIHLAGEGIATRRWSADQQARIGGTEITAARRNVPHPAPFAGRDDDASTHQ